MELPIPPTMPPLTAGMISSSTVASLLHFVKSDPQMLAKFGQLSNSAEYPPHCSPSPILPIPHMPSLATPPTGLPLASQVRVYTRESLY